MMSGKTSQELLDAVNEAIYTIAVVGTSYRDAEGNELTRDNLDGLRLMKRELLAEMAASHGHFTNYANIRG